MSPFPDEILADILSRLPVKCLLRLRCVSQSWLALISSPQFVKLHLNRSAKCKSSLSLFLSYYSIYRVDFDSLEDEVIQPAVVDYQPSNFNKGLRIWGCCDGLICISYHDDSVFLWNPSTRKSLKLPHESVEVPNLSNFNHNSYYGIASTCDDYKVVRIVEVSDQSGEFFDYEIMVYSLNSNSWHRSEKLPHFRNTSSMGDIAIAGVLHWTIDLGSESEQQEKSWIVAFDLETEKYRVIPQPEYDGPRKISLLHNFEGCLSLSCQYESMTTDIWILTEYGGKNESWSKLITVLPMTSIETLCPKPIAYSKSGKKVLLELYLEGLFWYNLEQESVESIMLYDIEELEDSHTCLESLVSLDVTAAIANAKSPREDEKNRQSSSEQRMNSDLGAHVPTDQILGEVKIDNLML